MFGRTIRFRHVKKTHLLILLAVGFLIGYWCVPRGSRPEREALRVVRTPAVRFTPSGDEFIVEGKEKRILSGAIHYFRVVPGYWEDRLRKLKASGLNTVETYMPWNLHEPIPGQFDFAGILDVSRFISIAQSLGLHVIIRPGPYICSEWDLGGLPPWLLHDKDMVLRSMYPGYLKAVERYFSKIFDILVPLQSSYGGPIIAFQIENELAEHPLDLAESQRYLHFLYDLMKDLGVIELLFTSDGQSSISKSLQLRPADDVLLTVNFMTDNTALDDLKNLQPNKPLMVMEFWTGWFDHWGEPHLTRNQQPVELGMKLEAMLKKGASFNLYMFHGGTNFGFMNGANWGYQGTSYLPTVTSYDYDAPISESGRVTEKFLEVRKAILAEARGSLSQFPLPSVPPNLPATGYGDVSLTLYIPIVNTLQYVPEPHVSDMPVAMEMLPLHGCGQSYGFVLYRTLIPAAAESVTIQQLRDYGQAMVDYKPVKRLNFFDSQTFVLPKTAPKERVDGQLVMDLLVENAGRINYASLLDSRKGILGGVSVDGKEQTIWKTYSLEFKSLFVKSIDTGGMWQRTPAPKNVGPSLFKGTFSIETAPMDTFLDMHGWDKGVVFINGVNLGRYWSIGPQRTLYVPSVILKRGVNKVMVFELYAAKTVQSLTFVKSPILSFV